VKVSCFAGRRCTVVVVGGEICSYPFKAPPRCPPTINLCRELGFGFTSKKCCATTATVPEQFTTVPRQSRNSPQLEQSAPTVHTSPQQFHNMPLPTLPTTRDIAKTKLEREHDREIVWQGLSVKFAPILSCPLHVLTDGRSYVARLWHCLVAAHKLALLMWCFSWWWEPLPPQIV
jgi:hypothetical protein